MNPFHFVTKTTEGINSPSVYRKSIPVGLMRTVRNALAAAMDSIERGCGPLLAVFGILSACASQNFSKMQGCAAGELGDLLAAAESVGYKNGLGA